VSGRGECVSEKRGRVYTFYFFEELCHPPLRFVRQLLASLEICGPTQLMQPVFIGVRRPLAALECGLTRPLWSAAARRRFFLTYLPANINILP